MTKSYRTSPEKERVPDPLFPPFSQSYTYDAWGNLSCSPAGPGCVALSYNSSNRITTSGYTYDAAGNLTGDGTHTYQWDAEAHLTVAYLSGTAVQTNTHNALGQRVRDVTQTNTTDEAYGADGSLLWRYTGSSSDPNQRAFVPFSGGILAEYYSGGTIFDHPDEIGSITTASDQTGNNLQERLYYPFGEAWTGVNLNNLGMHQTFSKLPDYDAETDQYNTLNRHYSPSGRWLSPDPGGLKVVRLDDPQTWNMYAYVRNNPTTLSDPSGLEPDPPKGTTDAQASNGCDEHNPATCKPDPAATGVDWKSLDKAQQGVLAGGKAAWDKMSGTQQANFAAITHALESVTLGNGATGLSEIKAGSAAMRKDGTEMDVSWKEGAAKAFESHGFSSRPGEHGGTNLGPTDKGIQRLHLVLGSKENQVHIDYRGLFEGHYKPYNDDVTARPGPERSPLLFGKPIVNSERYQQWYP